MTTEEITKYQLMMALKLATECQQAYHFLSNHLTNTRHTAPFNECSEDSCKAFHKAYHDIEDFHEAYKRSFPNLYGKAGGV